MTILAGSSIGLSLALRDPLANLFSGITVLASNKIQPGDYIRLSTGQEGYVTDIRWSDTYICELTDNLIVVPNALMTSTILRDGSQARGLGLLSVPPHTHRVTTEGFGAPDAEC